MTMLQPQETPSLKRSRTRVLLWPAPLPIEVLAANPARVLGLVIPCVDVLATAYPSCGRSSCRNCRQFLRSQQHDCPFQSDQEALLVCFTIRNELLSSLENIYLLAGLEQLPATVSLQNFATAIALIALAGGGLPLFEALNITPNSLFNVAPGQNVKNRACHPDPKADVQQIGGDNPETPDSEAGEVCHDAGNHRSAEGAPHPLQFQTLDWGRGVSQAGLTVVNDQDQWSNLWAQLCLNGPTPISVTTGQPLCPALPQVDFSTRTVLAVSAGLQGNPGYTINVTQVIEFRDHVEIQATLTTDGPYCVYAAVIVHPGHVIDIPKTQLPTFLTTIRIQAPSCPH